MCERIQSPLQVFPGGTTPVGISTSTNGFSVGIVSNNMEFENVDNNNSGNRINSGRQKLKAKKNQNLPRVSCCGFVHVSC